MTDRIACLVPFDPAESISLKQAAALAGRAPNTIRNWCESHGIGRLIAGRWCVSCVALAMFLDGDEAALRAYLAGERNKPAVAGYFARLVHN
jgi:hypothetical protein